MTRSKYISIIFLILNEQEDVTKKHFLRQFQHPSIFNLTAVYLHLYIYLRNNFLKIVIYYFEVLIKMEFRKGASRAYEFYILNVHRFLKKLLNDIQFKITYYGTNLCTTTHYPTLVNERSGK